MKQLLTVVLPMHNCERHLRASVLDILELAVSISATIEVVIVDNGSTDDTFETACELKRTYPQVKVLRQSVRQDLAAALEMVGHRLSVDRVVVYDGVMPVDSSQLKTLLQADLQLDSNSRQIEIQEAVAAKSAGSRRFASVRTLHQSMEQAHRPMTGFRWMQLEKPLVPRRRTSSSQPLLPISVPSIQPIVPTGMTPTV